MIPFARRRPFRWLYPSTWLLLVVLTTAATLIVVPGEIVDGEGLMAMTVDGRSHLMRAVLEYGWPWPYLEQKAHVSVPIKDPRGDIAWLWHYSWDFRRGKTSFHPLVLAADILLAAAFITACCWGWNRFRSRQPFWQFRLRGALLAVTCLAVLLGWHVHKQRQYRREMEIASKYDLAVFGKFGPHWLRKLVGNKGLAAVPGLGYRHIQHLSCERDDEFVTITPNHLRAFGELSELEHLQFGNVSGAEPDDFEPICKLKHLTVVATATPVSAATLAALCEIPQLRKLFVAGESLFDEDLQVTSKAQNLEELSLAGSRIGTGESTTPTHIGNDGLRMLVALPKLTHLMLGDCQIDEHGLNELDRSPRLKTVRFSSKRFDPAGVASFIARHPSWTAMKHGWRGGELAIERRASDPD